MSEYANYDDYNDEEEENEYDAVHGKKLTVGKIIKKTLLYSLRLIAFFVISILLWRIFSGNDPKSMQEFLWTDDSVKSFTQSPDTFEAYYYKHKDNLSRDGKFAASYVYFVPENGEFQITLRYNNSTLKKLAEDYDLDSVPTDESFVFTLTDKFGNTYTEYEYLSDKKNVYNYRRLIFKGIDMTNLLIEDAPVDADDTTKEDVAKKKEKAVLTLNVYYKNDVLFSEPYGTMSVYDYSYYHEPIDFSDFKGKDIEVISNTTPRLQYEVKPEPEETTQNN